MDMNASNQALAYADVNLTGDIRRIRKKAHLLLETFKYSCLAVNKRKLGYTEAGYRRNSLEN
jgi:hypothetical protein